MGKVDVTLSTGVDNAGIFHDLRYINDNEGGNSNASMLEIVNVGGNEIFAEGRITEYDPIAKKWNSNWHDLASGQGLDGIRVHITGSIENNEFLQMLQLILEAEKIVKIVKP